MKVFLADNIKITQFNFATNEGEYFIYDYLIANTNINCLITFEKKDGKWYIKSNGVVNVYSNNTSVHSAEVVEYANFKLKILGYNGIVNIFFSTFENEKNYQLNVSTSNKILIGSGGNCNIIYADTEIAPNQVVISKVENSWVLSSIEDAKYYTYINNHRVIKSILKAGDIIFINGLKIIWMQNFIIINNPKDKVKIVGFQAYNDTSRVDNTKVAPVSDEDQNYELYKDDDYFFHTPRMKEIYSEEEIEIEGPPSAMEDEKMPFYLKIGSSLTMIASSAIMAMNLIRSIQEKEGLLVLLPEILMLASMVIASLLLPKLIDRWHSKKQKEYMKLREEKYTEYLMQKEDLILQKTKRILQISNDNNLPSSKCKLVAVSPGNRNFWCREIASDDFLNVRLGVGTVNSPLKINAPESRFELVHEALNDKAIEIANKYKKIDNMPITFSFVENKVSSFICSGINKYDYFKNIIIQLIALHSGADLKIVILTDEDRASNWEYAKFLPHCWSEDNSFRYFATTQEEQKNISTKLQEEFQKRRAIVEGREKLKDSNNQEIVLDSEKIYSNFSCYYLIICDNYKNNLKIPILNDILNDRKNKLGFSFTILTNSLKNLPAECESFIEVGPTDGCILSREISLEGQKKFKTEIDTNIDLREISKTLLNVPLVPKEGLSVLPNSISFLEMYGVSRVEHLNVLNRWKTNNPVLSLSTPIGVNANGEQFKLDLHEKFHGPHGLIAGTTGSGKSEFIISYILSMCVNYHPYEVQFVLIDYKGGGLTGAFENRELGTCIPHLAGTITNLDTASMNRTLVSIKSELKRRQQIFNQTRDSLNEGTIDIYKYQKLFREGVVKDPLPHLFIISDEFAELKAQQPEFMDELISTARIGRSLGVHLILATQKPSGVVNDQIWSNSKFKICLKVQDRSDSMEVLKKPDAAFIKETGRFYLQVGNDDFYDKGQSGWSGAKYYPSDKIMKKVDDSINFVSNTGEVFKQIKDITVEQKEAQGEQLTSVVKHIIDLSLKENIKTSKLWLDIIPEKIYVANLKKKYNYTAEPYVINPVIGEYDSPKTQTQEILTCNFNKLGNILIAGKQGSGKENLLTTIILSSVLDHTPDEVNFYIIDYGTESLRMFSKMPHVGEISFESDKPLTLEMLNMLGKEIEYRKSIMSDYGGSYEQYIKDSGEKLPVIIAIINNYEVFEEDFTRYEDFLNSLYRDGPRYGVNFIVTEITPGAVRRRVEQYFNGKFILQQNNNSVYRGDFDAPRGLVPSAFFGRGLVVLEEQFYEFQTAFIVEKEEINKFVREAIKTYLEAYTTHAKKVPIVPEIVYDNPLYTNDMQLNNVPIGYNVKTKEVEHFDFTTNKFNQIICSDIDEDKTSFLFALAKMINKCQNVNIEIIDFVNAVEKDLDGIKVYNSDFENNLIEINNKILSNKDDSNTTVYMVLGAGMIKSKLSEQGIMIINKLYENSVSIDNVKFILMDVFVSYRNLLTEEWFQKNINNMTGIWLDVDPANQIMINVSKISMEDREEEFPQIAFKIVNSKPYMIKFMIEETEEGEEQDEK